MHVAGMHAHDVTTQLADDSCKAIRHGGLQYMITVLASTSRNDTLALQCVTLAASNSKTCHLMPEKSVGEDDTA